MTQIFPQRFDNDYRGHRLALWMFGAALLVKTAIALATIFNGRVAAQSADGVPLDSFGQAGAEAVITLFALWGVAQLAISFFGVLALVRYRAMVPLMYVVFVAELFARVAVVWLHPIARAGGTTRSYVNFIILPALLIPGLALALWQRRDSNAN